MSFIAILISIFIELGLKQLEDWRRFGWFEQLTDWILLQMKNTRAQEGPLTLIAVLAPVVLVTWLIAAVLSGVWVVFAFIFSVLILTVTLGPHDPLRITQEYLAALDQNDEEAAAAHIKTLLGSTSDDDLAVTVQNMKETLFIKLVTHILGVFFWFVILGPLGAVLFRANCLLRARFAGANNGFTNAIEELHKILIWIPARLAVIGYAVTGSFVHTLESVSQLSDLWTMDSEKLLIECGLGAISPADETKDNEPDIHGLHLALALVKRTVLAWLTVLGLLVITGWLS
jgi:AmpE protein